MGKCSSCSEGKCNGKYENRNKCDDPSNCTCTCQESSNATFWKGFGSLALGVTAFVGGTVLTIATAGAGLAVVPAIASFAGCGALTGIGATAAIQPVAKQISGERMTGGDYVKDLAISGTIGAVTGPIGFGGASATNAIATNFGKEAGKQGLVKFGCRTAVGAVSGATSSVIQEGVHGQFKLGNVVKGTLLGAATGGASHISGNVVNKVGETDFARVVNKVAEMDIVCSATKVAADTVSTVAIDTSYQLLDKGTVDENKLVFNAAARAATSAGTEAVTNMTYNYHGGKEAFEIKQHNKKKLSEFDSEQRDKMTETMEAIEKIPVDKVKEELRKANEYTDAKKTTEEKRQNLMEDRKNLQTKEANINSKMQDEEFILSHFPKEYHQMVSKELKDQLRESQVELKNLGKKESELNSSLNKMPKPQKMQESYDVHALDGHHKGQIAATVQIPNEKGEMLQRIVVDPVETKDRKNYLYKFSGYTPNHKYDDMPNHGEVPVPELNVPKPFFMPKGDEDDDEKKNK